MLHPEKYNALIYHMKKVIDISRELEIDDLNIIEEFLKIKQSKIRIANIRNLNK